MMTMTDDENQDSEEHNLDTAEEDEVGLIISTLKASLAKCL